jgi:hypothetical protein
MRKNALLFTSFILFILASSVALSETVYKGSCSNPTDPNNPNYCGKKSGSPGANCYCDSACLNAKDCCANYTSVCAQSVGAGVPQPPFSLEVSTAKDDYGKLIAKLTWQNVDGEKFWVYKNKNDGSWGYIATTQNKYFKDESGLGADVKYGYYVTAVNSYGSSSPSNKVYVNPSAVQVATNLANEYVQCYFPKGSGWQSCYSSVYKKGDYLTASNCSVNTNIYSNCTSFVNGTSGQIVKWGSPYCNPKDNYQTTSLDGINENVYFENCNLIGQIPQPPFNLEVSTAKDDYGKLIAKLTWQNVDGEKFWVYKNKNDGS